MYYLIISNTYFKSKIMNYVPNQSNYLKSKLY